MQNDESKWTLDGRPIENLSQFILDNEFDEATEDAIMDLAPGASILLGGGAGAEFVLRREA